MSKAPAYGGVVIDEEGRVLLREPAGHYDGYVWTFAKGRPNADESPEDTACRETLEETGIEVEIVARIPGEFEGGVTVNIYFLMRPSGAVTDPVGETASVRWATREEAPDLIRQSKNALGRKRDLAVLEAALSLVDQRAAS